MTEGIHLDMKKCVETGVCPKWTIGSDLLGKSIYGCKLQLVHISVSSSDSKILKLSSTHCISQKSSRPTNNQVHVVYQQHRTSLCLVTTEAMLLLFTCSVKDIQAAFFGSFSKG